MLPFHDNGSINSLSDQCITLAGNHCMKERSDLARVEVVRGNQGSESYEVVQKAAKPRL